MRQHVSGRAFRGFAGRHVRGVDYVHAVGGAVFPQPAVELQGRFHVRRLKAALYPQWGQTSLPFSTSARSEYPPQRGQISNMEFLPEKCARTRKIRAQYVIQLMLSSQPAISSIMPISHKRVQDRYLSRMSRAHTKASDTCFASSPSSAGVRGMPVSAMVS